MMGIFMALDIAATILGHEPGKVPSEDAERCQRLAAALCAWPKKPKGKPN